MKSKSLEYDEMHWQFRSYSYAGYMGIIIIWIGWFHKKSDQTLQPNEPAWTLHLSQWF